MERNGKKGHIGLVFFEKVHGGENGEGKWQLKKNPPGKKKFFRRIEHTNESITIVFSGNREQKGTGPFGWKKWEGFQGIRICNGKDHPECFSVQHSENGNASVILRPGMLVGVVYSYPNPYHLLPQKVNCLVCVIRTGRKLGPVGMYNHAIRLKNDGVLRLPEVFI